MMEYEATILVTRGDEMPKKNYAKKLHPTYETCIKLKNAGTDKVTVVKFFDQYRTLSNDLVALGVGENLKVSIDAKFPPSQSQSMFGIAMSEDALQQRCYMLNKWMGSLFAVFHLMPPEAQGVVAKFLSADDDDEVVEKNKNLLLELMYVVQSVIFLSEAVSSQKKKDHSKPAQPAAAPAVSSPSNAASTATSTATSAPSAAAAPATVASPEKESSVASEGSGSGAMRRASTQTTTAAGGGGGRRASTVSTADVFSPLELEVMGKENVFNTFLAVHITQGDMMPKRPDETKLHISYQTVLRVLPFDDFNMPGKSDLDGEAYNALLAFLRPVKVSKTFDSYRNLKENLEKAGVYFSESPSNPAGALVVDAPFPKTYAKSVMGFVLNEAQVAQRVAMLNNWMGRVLAAYPSLSGSAQNLITTFFSIASHIPSDTHYDIFLKMLQKNYVPPRKAHQNGESATSSSSSSSSSGGGKFSLFSKSTPAPSASSGAANTPPPPPATTTATTAAAATEEEQEEDDRDRKSVAATVYNAGDLASLGREQILKSFLGISVSRGEKYSNDSKRVHHAYETRLRIVDLNEVAATGFDVKDIDTAAYAKLHGYANNCTMQIFDNYRSLKTALQTCHVYSKDTAAQALKDKQSIVINAAFPKTYPKSKLGIGLTESEINQRTSILNNWMCVMLSMFDKMPENAQEKVIQFLSLDEDNPAEPQNRVIQQILRGTFKPPKKVVVATTSGKSKGSSGAAAGGKPTAKYLQGEDQEDPERAPAVATRGCCTIM